MDYEYLNEYLYYSEDSPSFLRWRNDRFSGKNGRIRKVKAGDPAGSLSNRTGYYTVCLNYKNFLVHRVVWALTFKLRYDSFADIDHIDGNRGNNELSNLREVDHALNTRNAGIRAKNNTGYTGVQYSSREKEGKSPMYVASWVELGGKCRSKSFSVSVYGDELAEFLAREYRRHQLDLLNLQGAGYTKRHFGDADLA